MNAFRRSSAITGLVLALTLSACQSTAPRGSGTVTLPENADAGWLTDRHAPARAAVDRLGKALATEPASLDGIVFDDRLRGAAAALGLPIDATTLNRFDLLDGGPYRLVHADLANGRLEYRSVESAEHVAFFVRAAGPDEGERFVVTDVFAQASLVDRLADANRTTTASVDTSAVPVAMRRTAEDDAAALARLADLPPLERNRRDVLALRAMTSLRSGEIGAAASLVQTGIVRYPDAPIFYAVASALLAQDAGDRSKASSDLDAIAKARFTARERQAATRRLDRFLAGSASS